MLDISEIEPGLFVSGEIESLPDGVQAVIDLQFEHLDQLKPNGLKALLWLPMHDAPDYAPTTRWLDNVVNTMKGWRADGWNVLVHCRAGVSRSGMVAIAFVMNVNGLTLQEALHCVQERRPCVYPNSGFMNSLSQYEDMLKLRRGN